MCEREWQEELRAQRHLRRKKEFGYLTNLSGHKYAVVPPSRVLKVIEAGKFGLLCDTSNVVGAARLWSK